MQIQINIDRGRDGDVDRDVGNQYGVLDIDYSTQDIGYQM